MCNTKMPTKSSVEDISYNANLWLQAAMLINVYMSLIWGIIYGCYILYNLSELQDFYGRAVIVAYILSLLAEVYRLRAGYKGNLGAEISELSIFLVTTPLIQLPLLAFLFLAVRGDWTIIYLIIELMFCLMLIELIAGMWAWHMFAKHQNDLHKLKRQIALQMRNAKKESANAADTWNVL
ncbi:transmembrane protein 17-like [Bactrocera neohumeralis]|uniref:transmembrane protein 17-like n=1 Tax=Bactrocera neohumeralis TaxID=98809 RepID=UPI002165DDBE|nr:transmembrane protein 17-like [Bactrocera neohumeralis]